MTEPITWFCDIDGPEGTVTLKMGTGDMQNYLTFQRYCMDFANILFKHLKHDTWTSLLSEAIQRAELVDAPPDLRAGGRFRELMETFLTNRQRGETKEDLLRGAPWEDEETGRHYFRLADLQRFLDREGTKMTRGEITREIKRMHNHYDEEGRLVDGDVTDDPEFYPHEGKNIKGKFINLWWVPSEAISETPELDAPQLPREAI
jgi:hypothetical protein